MPEQRTYDESILLEQLARGEQEALERIYKMLWQKLFMAAYAILRDKKACEDIIQDLFLQLWVKRESIVVRKSIESYLISAVRYQVFRYIRNHPAPHLFLEDLEERLTEPSSEMRLHYKEITEIVHQTITELPEKCRKVYRLSREQQLSHKEIAERLQISTKTVENHLSIALRKLRNSLSRFASFWMF